MIRKRKVDTYETRLYCDKCNAEMEPVEVLMSNPPQYVYVCPNCGEEVTMNEQYPNISYERVITRFR